MNAECAASQLSREPFEPERDSEVARPGTEISNVRPVPRGSSYHPQKWQVGQSRQFPKVVFVMTVMNPPAKLTLLNPPARARAHARKSHATPIPFRARCHRDAGASPLLAGHADLIERLSVVAALGPDAPLSFVVVKVDGLSELNRSFGWDAGSEALRAIGQEVCRVVRATDLAGRLTSTMFGIVLQGSGATAAEAVAARLSYRINRLLPGSQPVSVRVSAATGTGVNADVLPVAALESFRPEE